MIPLEKPGTPEELVHVGVKGMKWGVRKSTQEFKERHPTRRERNKAIKTARKNIKNSPVITRDDRAVALRLTTGEKATLSILALSGVGTLPIAVFTTARVSARRTLEKE